MGYYINPKDMTKEEWLIKHAVGEAPIEAPASHRKDDNVAVVLVHNGGFTAAGIAVDQRELEAFAHPDMRPKIWLWVPIADIYALHPEFEGSISDVQ